MNVLLTSAGRRNYLVHYFKEALGSRGRVLAADMSVNAAALQEADDAFILPDAHDPNYIVSLLSLCRSQQVKMVIPLNDLELPILAATKARFLNEGIMVVVSGTDVVSTCLDKYKTYLFAETNGIATPQTFFSTEDVRRALDAGFLNFPLVIKPRCGSASFGVEICHDWDELFHIHEISRKRLARSCVTGFNTATENGILIQAKICGLEYGLDVVNDLSGCYMTTFVKQKIAMRAGETDKAVSIDHEVLSAIGEKIGRTLRHVANLDIDVFACGKDYYLMDMNPRFGGGYPFSHIAGANLPAAILAWAEGKTPDPSWLNVHSGVAAAKSCRMVAIKQILRS